MRVICQYLNLQPGELIALAVGGVMIVAFTLVLFIDRAQFN
jgi:hypothetical protein